MRTRIILVGLVCSFCAGLLSAQLLHDRKGIQFTRADSLRGMLTPLRTCYDITYYDLTVTVDPSAKSIRGTNDIFFRVVHPFTTLQIDLFENMSIRSIILDGSVSLQYSREYGAVFVEVPHHLAVGSIHRISVEYSGEPIVAQRPPWEGGFIWTEDDEGNPWVAVACQGTGASLWWPTKEHQSDEPDSMMLRVTVPPGLQNVSNGRLREMVIQPNGWTRFDWFISYPINNYNVTLNIGKFAHIRDFHAGSDSLTLDYYVLPKNLEKAERQFRQVKPMMECFEHRFGPYPFVRDGFKLIESPHLGMEHQTAVAYGNNYIQGYRGASSSAVGIRFDFIIIHETAHEWWGNSVTSNDIADMWIHESFGAYSEAIYVECLFGYEEALRYINGKKYNVGNVRPIIGVYGVNNEGSGDMYDKGQLVLNTLRHLLDDDELWFSIVKGLATTFRYRSIDAQDVFDYINQQSGRDLSYFFDQYFKYAAIPQLEVVFTHEADKSFARFRWRADVNEFAMPVKVTWDGKSWGWLTPTTRWQQQDIPASASDDFRVDEDSFYINVKTWSRYVDPNRRRGQ